jgi:hypothetical protein
VKHVRVDIQRRVFVLMSRNRRFEVMIPAPTSALIFFVAIQFFITENRPFQMMSTNRHDADGL